MEKSIENVIEFYRDDDMASVTFSKKSFINKVKKLREEYPDIILQFFENNDGTVCASIPVSWIKISPPKTRTLSEEERAMLSERMKQLISKRG